MKKIGLIFLLFCWAVFCLGALALAEEASYQPQREIKKYFPGDYVHVMVDAPSDTAKITAVMPNGDMIELVHDRRAGIWTGLWQVPIGFKTGSYSADLQASDIEGNKYSGLTSPFIIGELTMITMIQKPVTPEAETPVQQDQRLSRETALLAAKAVTPIPHPQVPPAKVVQPKPVRPAPRIAPPPAKKKVVIAAKKKVRPARPKAAVNFVEAKEKTDLNLTKAKIVTNARYYMERMDFNKVQSQLRTLVKIDPHNQQYRKMLQRVNTVVKAEKERSK